MTCDEALVLISGEIDGENTAQQTEILRLHLHTCAQCRQVLQAFEGINGVLSELVVEPPEDLKSRIMAAVHAEPRRKRRLWQPVAAAAALFLLIGAGAAGLQRTSQQDAGVPAVMSVAVNQPVQAASARSMQNAPEEKRAVGFSIQATALNQGQALADQRGADVAVTGTTLPELEQWKGELLEDGSILYCIHDADGASELSRAYELELYRPSQQHSSKVSYVLLLP